MNIRVDLNYPIKDGTEVVFRSPVDCSQVTGLKVYYRGEDGNAAAQEFVLADAHGNNVGDIDHLFAENVAVKVILDVTTGMAFVQNADTNAYLESRFDGLSDSIVCEASGSTIIITDSSDRKLQRFSIYGKTTQNGTALNSTGDNGSIGIDVYGRNLIDPTAFFKNSSVSTDSSGKPKVSLSRDAFTVFFNNKGLYINSRLKPVWFNPGTYTFTMFSDSVFTEYLCTYRVNADGSLGTNINNYAVTANTPRTFTEYEPFILTIGGHADGQGTFTFRLQLEVGKTGTAYEPYKAPQTLTATTPNGLPGIPVTSGGNYTDENGQQWICDEIDFANGKYIRRIGVCNPVFKSAGSNGAGGKVATAVLPYPKIGKRGGIISSHATVTGSIPPSDGCCAEDELSIFFGGVAGDTVETMNAKYGNSTLIYVLADPIVNDLSADELESCAKFHPNKPKNLICNDSGAWMAVEWVADTKIYIDNKFTELQYAILASGANV